ncbi:MAG: transposase [Actinomycetota bacterium]
MGRPARIDSPGQWHHVMNRGAGRRIVFRDDDERSAFLDLVGELDERFGVEVHAYCLLGNHFHLLVRSTEGRLSGGMQWLGGNFTRLVNGRRCVDGPIFRGRFHAVPVPREQHLRWLIRYISRNPVDLGWGTRLAEYPWSSLAALLGERSSPSWLRRELCHRFFGRDVDALRAFVTTDARGPLCDQPAPPFEEIRDAVEVARAPGPDVLGRADVRAAILVLSSGVDDEPSADAAAALGLDATSLRRAVQRARTRVDDRTDVRALVERAWEVLAIGQMVSDTVCPARR